MKLGSSAVLVLGLAAYLVAFYQTRLPTLEDKLGGIWTRWDLVQLGLSFPATLVEGWFGTPPEFAIWDRLPLLLCTMAIFGWAVALGWLGLGVLGIDRALTRLETGVFSVAVGLATIANYVLLVGLAGGLHTPGWFAIAMLGTLGLAAWRLWRDLRRQRAATTRGEGATDAGNTDDPSDCGVRLHSRWLWLAAPFAGVLVLGGMLPPIEFDMLEYHLQAPKEFYCQGYVSFLPHNVYANMPLGAEMLSLLSMVFLGDWWIGGLAGKTATAATTLVATFGVYAATLRLFGRTAATVAAIVYVSVPWIVQVSTLGMIESAVAMYWLLAVYAYLLWQLGDAENTDTADDSPPAGSNRPNRGRFARANWLRGNPRMLLLAGYMAGAAMACKYPAALFVVLPLLLAAAASAAAARLSSSAGGGELGRDIARNAASPPAPLRQAGDANPPDSGTRLPAAPRPPAGTRGMARNTQAARAALAASGFFLIAATAVVGPWLVKNAVLAGNPTYPLLYEFFGGRSWDAEADAQWNRVHRPHDFSPTRAAGDLRQVLLGSQWLSPLVVPLAVVGLFSRRHRRLLFAIAGYFGLVVLAWWLFTHRIDRFWIPTMPLLAVMAGAGACVPRGRLWRGGLLTLLVLGSLSNFLFDTVGLGGYNRYFASLAQLRHDPERVDPWHLWLNRFPPGGTVALVGEAGVFDLEVPIRYSTCFDENPLKQLAHDATAVEFHRRLATEGIELVFVHWGEIARYRRSYGFDPFFQPEWFEAMTAAGVWEPLPAMPGHRGRMYRVLPLPASTEPVR